MNIHVHIERLILDGIPLEPGQAAQLQAAVEAELGRLLAENSLPPGLLAGGAFGALRAAPIQLAPQSQPASQGAQIAQAAYGSLGR